VLREHLVLVCPACQEAADWTADLDNCARCGGVHMIRRLDQVECLDCGQVRDADRVPGAGPGTEPGTGPDAGPAQDAAFADEVSRALERVLRQRLLLPVLLCLFYGL
jgi:hypothetical protein